MASRPTTWEAVQPPTFLRRLGQMAFLWVILGSIVGICTVGAGGTILLIAGGIAGVVVLVPVGVILALLGARWPETLACATAGFLVGAGAGLFLESVGTLAATGLIFGGLVGGTFLAVFYRLPRMLLKRLATQS